MAIIIRSHLSCRGFSSSVIRGLDFLSPGVRSFRSRSVVVLVLGCFFIPGGPGCCCYFPCCWLTKMRGFLRSAAANTVEFAEGFAIFRCLLPFGVVRSLSNPLMMLWELLLSFFS